MSVSEGAEDDDELCIEEDKDEGSDAGEEDELEAVIASELAKFQQQQEQKYAQLRQASAGAPAVLPSPAPAQQQLRAVERQAALARDAASWVQQERSEYLPPVRPCTAAAVGPAAHSQHGRPASAMPSPAAAAAAAEQAAHPAAGSASAGRNADARQADGSAAVHAGNTPEPATGQSAAGVAAAIQPRQQAAGDVDEERAGPADGGNASQSLTEAPGSSDEAAAVSRHQPPASSPQASRLEAQSNGTCAAAGPADEEQGSCKPPYLGVLQSVRPRQPAQHQQHPAAAAEVAGNSVDQANCEEPVLEAAQGADHLHASAVAAVAAEPSTAGVEEEEERAASHHLGPDPGTEAEPVPLQAADVDADDGFIYQDDDDGADASSGCSSPLTAVAGCVTSATRCSTPDPAPVATAAVAAAATSRPGADDCKHAGQADASSSCCFLTGSEGEPLQQAQEQQQHQRQLYDACGSPWPVSDGGDAIGSPLPGCGEVAMAAAERRGRQQHLSPSKQRPVHSRNRPTGRGSPALEAVAAAVAAAAGGAGGGSSGDRVRLRPGSAPSVPRGRPLSPSKLQGSGHSSCITQQFAGSGKGWPLGSGAGPAGAQLHRANHGSSLPGGGCSADFAARQAGSSGDMRPHTSAGISWSETQTAGQLPQQQPAAALWAGWAASPGPGSSEDCRHSSVHSSRAALQPLRGNTNRGQAAAGGRPRSANTLRARLPATPACADSSRITSSSQRIRPSSSSSRAHQQSSVRLPSHQQELLQPWQQAQLLRGSGGCWPPDVWGSSQHGNLPGVLPQQQQQQQQQPARHQPAWNSSPIPLCTPKTVPIGAATLSPEALLHTGTQHNQHSAASGQLLHGSAGCSHWQCVGEPRCCFAAGTCSSRAGDPSRPHTAGAASAACGEGQGRPIASVGQAGGRRPVSGGNGSSPGGAGSSGASAASAGRSAYLVEILSKVRQANNCCRRLGLPDRQFRLARSDKQCWQLEQIEVEVWQQQQEAAAAGGPGGGEPGAGWQLQSVLTLVQFNKQLAKLASRAATTGGGGECQ